MTTKLGVRLWALAAVIPALTRSSFAFAAGLLAPAGLFFFLFVGDFIGEQIFHQAAPETVRRFFNRLRRFGSLGRRRRLRLQGLYRGLRAFRQRRVLRQFIDGFALGSGASVSIVVRRSGNLHHLYETLFRALGDAVGQALGTGSRRLSDDTSGLARRCVYTVSGAV